MQPVGLRYCAVVMSAALLVVIGVAQVKPIARDDLRGRVHNGPQACLQ